MRTSALLAVLALLGLLGAAARPAVAEPKPVAIGVVDVLELINSYPGYKKAKDALEAAAKGAQAHFDAAKKEIEATEARLKIEVAQNAPNRVAQEKTLAQQKMMAEFELKWKIRVAQDEYMATLIKVHGEVYGYVAQYARGAGIGIVLQMTKEPLTGKSPDELIPNIVVRSVFWYDPTLDITGAVKATFPAATPPAPR
jgi:Skp family chaperone for outer membrane proteins